MRGRIETMALDITLTAQVIVSTKNGVPMCVTCAAYVSARSQLRQTPYDVFREQGTTYKDEYARLRQDFRAHLCTPHVIPVAFRLVPAEGQRRLRRNLIASGEMQAR